MSGLDPSQNYFFNTVRKRKQGKQVYHSIFVFQVKALEAEVINLRKEIEIMRNQHKVVDKQRLKAIQVNWPKNLIL